jgi:hypothetical protein
MAFSLSLGRGAKQAFTLLAAFLLSVAIIYFDVLAMGGAMGENSPVQLSQAILVLGSAAFFALGARTNSDQRGYLLLVATLFLCMFVRENDGLLDGIVHGFWLVPVLMIAVAGGGAVIYNRATLRGPAHQHAQDGSFWILAVGFLQLVVFSRLFGSGLLWDQVPGQHDLEAAKTIVQESTELVSYSLIFLGSYLSHKYRYGKS